MPRQKRVALPGEVLSRWQGFCIANHMLVRLCDKFRVQLARRVCVWLLGLTVLSLSCAEATQSVTLGWDSSTDVNAAGYNIYYGTSSHIYLSKVSVGNVTTATVGGLVDGVTYYIAATTYDTSTLESSYCDEITYTATNNAANLPPAITSLLATNAAILGQNLNFSVTASGTGPLAYQWVFNGSNIISANNFILPLNGVTFAQTGTYSVVVSNNFGSVTSAAVNLTVSLGAPVLTPGAPVNGQFALNVVGQPGYQYAVQASTNLVNWISIATNISPFNFVDSDASRFRQRFYRTYFLGLPTTNDVNDVTIGLIARYPLAANGNDLQNGNNLTLAGFPSFSAGAVNWNGAVPTLGYSAPRQWPQSGVTVSAWINMTDPSANYVVASCYGDSSGQLQQAYMQFCTLNGKLIARLVQHIDIDYIGRTTSASLTTGWHFVAFTWAGGTASSSISIYLDGVRVDNSDANGGNFTGIYSGADLPISVGAQFSDGWGISGRFYGQENGVRMYDRALSLNEIDTLYSNGLSGNHY